MTAASNIELDRIVVARDRAAERKRAGVLPFQTFSEIGGSAPIKRHIIKGVFARGETSAWVGPPGSLKSALMASAAVSIASGTNWMGKRSKSKAAVAYFALERPDLVRRRLQAHRERDGLDDNLPIAVVGSTVNLMSAQTVPMLLATINRIGDEFGLAVGTVIFDTYAKLIAAGGGDEDKARDQGAVLANIHRLKEALSDPPHVALVGHTGKDETRGARGSNALLGDVDLMVTLSGDAVRTATIIKANDAPEGELFSFGSEVHSFGADEDGEEITVNIVTNETLAAPQGRVKRPDRLPKGTQTALRALAEAVDEQGTIPPGMNGRLPAGMKAISVAAWRQHAYNVGISTSDDPRAQQQAFKRAFDHLVDISRVGHWDGYVWLPA